MVAIKIYKFSEMYVLVRIAYINFIATGEEGDCYLIHSGANNMPDLLMHYSI